MVVVAVVVALALSSAACCLRAPLADAPNATLLAQAPFGAVCAPLRGERLRRATQTEQAMYICSYVYMFTYVLPYISRWTMYGLDKTDAEGGPTAGSAASAHGKTTWSAASTALMPHHVRKKQRALMPHRRGKQQRALMPHRRGKKQQALMFHRLGLGLLI